MRTTTTLALASLFSLAACEIPAPAKHRPPPSAPPSAATTAPTPAIESETRDLARFREEVRRSSNAYATLVSLVDASGARLTGSPGYDAAVAWAKRALPAAGLANVRTEAVKAHHWVRGSESASVVAPSPHALAIAALGGSVGTPKEGLEAEVIEVPTLDAIDKLAPSDVAGKIVYFDTHMERSADGRGYGTAVPVRGKGASRAAKLGAIAVLVRSIGTDDDRLPHTGALRYDDAAPKIPAAAVSIADANLVHRLIASGQRVRVKLALGAETLPDVEVANVLGDVPGAVAPEEIVLLGAHLDSWDLGHGAEDDGAGCAIVIEAARQIARRAKRPRRTVRVVLYANEENGLAGGDGYAKAHAAEVDKHVVALEADFGSGPVHDARFGGTAEGRATLTGLLEPAAIAVAAQEAHGGADVSSLHDLGVPVVDLVQDGTRYFDVHHTANDTVEHVDKNELDAAAAAFAAAALAIAESDAPLGRAPSKK